jgi:hypothetical protein
MLTPRINNSIYRHVSVDDGDYAKLHGVELLNGEEAVFTVSWKQPDQNQPWTYRQAHATESGTFVVYPVRRIRSALRARGITYPADAVDVWATSDTLSVAIAEAERLLNDAA